MLKPEIIVIPLSKVKITKGIIALAACVIVGYWLLSLDSSTIQSGRKFNNQIIVHSIGFLLVLIAIIGISVLPRFIFNGSSAVVINGSGVVDNLSLVSPGIILWSEISGFKKVYINNILILYIILKKPSNYISRCNPIQRLFLRATKNLGPSPAVISTSLLKIDPNELVSILENSLLNYAKNP